VLINFSINVINKQAHVWRILIIRGDFMEIISMSLDRETVGKLNAIQKKLGFRSRSKLMRATIDSLLNEYKVMEELAGHCDAVFTVTYNYGKKDALGHLLAQFEDVIRTEMHQHHEGVHLRVLIICGQAKRIRELFAALKTGKMVRSLSVSLL
jgi:metal-responsive CopG/Arc/MetJ family transcriptional regulator